MNTSMLKVYFKYTFKFEHKCINLESLHHVYMLLSLQVNTSIFKINFKCTSKFQMKYINLESVL